VQGLGGGGMVPVAQVTTYLVANAVSLTASVRQTLGTAPAGRLAAQRQAHPAWAVLSKPANDAQSISHAVGPEDSWLALHFMVTGRIIRLVH